LHEEISIGGGHPDLLACVLNLKVMERVKGEVIMGRDEMGKG
jgi:hypothetical protein